VGRRAADGGQLWTTQALQHDVELRPWHTVAKDLYDAPSEQPLPDSLSVQPGEVGHLGQQPDNVGWRDALQLSKCCKTS